MVGAGAAFSIVQATVNYTQGVRPEKVEYEEEEVERREAIRKMRRRPLEETIEQLGEGRGESSQFKFEHAIRYQC